VGKDYLSTGQFPPVSFPSDFFLMKTSFLPALLALTLVGAQTQIAGSQTTQTGVNQTAPPPTAYHIVDQGANYRVWQRETYELTPDGQIRTHIHKFNELSSGLNYWNNGQWVASQEIIGTYSSGAVANQGQYQVIFANNLNSAGSIDMQTPDGKQLESSILGLAYYDSSTGSNVLIAQIQDSQGELISSNQALYPNAFEGVKADIRYTYKKGSFEQDVILREQPPAPESLGLNSDTTEIEVLTEFIDPPQASIVNNTVKNNSLPDEDISWGAMRIGRGKAFDLGETPNAHSHIPVRRQYVTVQGRNILIEGVPMQKIQSYLESLPLQSSSETKLPATASKTVVLPRTPLAQAKARPMKLASASKSDKGFVLDYVELNTDQADYTFQADTTYYISGSVSISGTATFEGGTVIKYADCVSLLIGYNPPSYLTAPYRPAILTSMDDDTAGEIISGSSGSPSILEDADYIADQDGVLAEHMINGMRFLYAGTGYDNEASCSSFTFQDCQFVQCGTCVEVDDAIGLVFNNDLFTQCGLLFNGGLTLWACNITADECSSFDDCDCNNGGITNSILTGVGIDTNEYVFNHSVVLATNTGIFQTIVGGDYYLADDSPYRNAGTTNIDPAVLADIATKTTYPPIAYSNTAISITTTFCPQAQRDTDTPDLGYHYDPMDYVFANIEADTNIIFTAGTAVGWFRTTSGWYDAGDGIHMMNNVAVSFNGTATAPDYWVRCNDVQEQDFTGGYGPGGLTSWGSGPSTYVATVNAQFTRCMQQGGDDGYFRDDGCCGGGHFVLNAENCEFYSTGFGAYYVTFYITNCLFYRASCGVMNDHNDAGIAMVNCTSVGRSDGTVTIQHWGSTFPAYIVNCAFQNASFPNVDAVNAYYDYNAYETNADRSVMGGSHDVTNIISYNWQSSWFGNFYQSTNSPLIQAGNTTADQIGLYHFTTQTNQVPETNSIVDIGYHYVATDAYGNPLDSNDDGIPDYIEDANGNGLDDSGEIGWDIVGDLGLKVVITQPRNGSSLP